MGMPEDGAGHRARLWKRFEKGGLRGAFVHPYEKLEFLLTFTIPRADTKPIARSLLKRFGSITGVLNATPQKLQEVAGVGSKTALFLNMLNEVGLVVDEEQFGKRNLLNHPDLVKAWLRHDLALAEMEYLVVFYLDGHCRLIHKERLVRGTVDQVAHYPREIAREAIAHNATGVILAHNHPSGDPTPSNRDVSATHKALQALQLLDITLHDHLVVARDGINSMSEMGLI